MHPLFSLSFAAARIYFILLLFAGKLVLVIFRLLLHFKYIYSREKDIFGLQQQQQQQNPIFYGICVSFFHPAFFAHFYVVGNFKYVIYYDSSGKWVCACVCVYVYLSLFMYLI